MKHPNIGVMRYDLLAQANRPTDPKILAAEVRRLSAGGLTAVDIAMALRLALPAVLEMLVKP